MSIGEFETEKEAVNAEKYIKTKFTRTLLGLLKITQHITPATWSYVPIQNFTSTSDIDWSTTVSNIDKQLYKKYGLSQEEIDFIETHVKEME
jgi:type II restriction enzyme